MKNKHIYNWMFHYNQHSKLWYAFHRDDYREYWNGESKKHALLAADNIESLIKMTDHHAESYERSNTKRGT